MSPDSIGGQPIPGLIRPYLGPIEGWGKNDPTLYGGGTPALPPVTRGVVIFGKKKSEKNHEDS